MSGENIQTVTTIITTEALNSGHQYHAVALADGKLANTGNEATGILKNKPASGQAATLAIDGEVKFAAGAAIAKAAKVTVTTSGWFTTAGSGDYIVGKAKAAVTSGSVGTGFFNFASAIYAFSSSFIA